MITDELTVLFNEMVQNEVDPPGELTVDEPKVCEGR